MVSDYDGHYKEKEAAREKAFASVWKSHLPESTIKQLGLEGGIIDNQ